MTGETGIEPNRSVDFGLMQGMELSLKDTMDLGLGHQQGMEQGLTHTLQMGLGQNTLESSLIFFTA